MKYLRLVFALTVGCPAFAQAPPAGGASADDLRACAFALAGGLAGDQKSQKIAEEIHTNAGVLATGLRGKTGIPAAYLANLNELVGICRSMLMSVAPGSQPLGFNRNVSNVEFVARDIAVKAGDLAGQLTGRLIPIEARTFKGGQPDNGWMVYYQWMPTSPVKDAALAAPTPGATGIVVPGMYSFHAEKTVNGRKIVSQPKIMPIGGYPKVQIAITVP